MTKVAGQSSSLRVPIACTAFGGFLLLAVLVPSPVRIALWSHEKVTAPHVQFPTAAREISSSELSAIIERPLFNNGRKKDPAADATDESSGLNAYRLAGVIAMGTTGVAIIERKTTKTTVTLKVGDALDGRTVSNITSDGVTFSGPAGSETLRMPKSPGATGTTETEHKSGTLEHAVPAVGGREHR